MLNTLLKQTFRLTIKTIAKFYPAFPAILESEIQHFQGKGWGSHSIDFEVKQALNFLQGSGDKLIVLDIGANIGRYSEAILRLKPNSKIFAFEPSSIARKVLTDKYDSDSRIEIFPFAVSNAAGSSILYSDFPGSGSASLLKRRLNHFNVSFDISESVEVITVDGWNKDLKIDLIKIDVEGFEFNVLKGAINSLKFTKVVQFEFGGTHIDSRIFFQDYWYFFQRINFKIYRITPFGAFEIRSYDENDEHFRATNYLAVNQSSLNV
jgi:FkbM family methyltransferase